MKTLRVGVTAAASLALILSGCASNETTTGGSTGSSGSSTGATLSGSLQGTGASSMRAAQEAWIAAFQTAHSGVAITYSPEGSGAGRTAFINGGADFAGSDRALKDDEMGAGKFANCTADSNAMNLPVYISAIAIIFNVPNVSSLNMDADTVAKIFAGTITNWNDPAIAALNSGVTLPDLAITAVHRSDTSGTTENFTATLAEAAPSVWTNASSGDWPAGLPGEAAQGTSGVVQAVKSGTGMIGYADESQIGDLNAVLYGSGSTFVGPTAEAAAQIVENSPKVTGRGDLDQAIKLDRTAAGYPFVLISYAIACETYKDANKAELVKAYLGYVASTEGQEKAQETAGSAPLSSSLRTDVLASTDAIK